MEATHEMTKHRDSIRDEVAKLKERENVLLAERDALSSNVKSLEVALDEECNKYLRANDAKIQALKIEVTSLHSGNEELKLSLRTEEQRREECALQQRQTESELRDWVSKFEKVDFSRRFRVDFIGAPEQNLSIFTDLVLVRSPCLIGRSRPSIIHRWKALIAKEKKKERKEGRREGVWVVFCHQ